MNAGFGQRAVAVAWTSPRLEVDAGDIAHAGRGAPRESTCVIDCPFSLKMPMKRSVQPLVRGRE